MARIRLSVLFCLLVIPATSLAQELAVDHVWIHVEKGAPEANTLVDAGIQIERNSEIVQMVGGIVQHKGQGTASIAVRFRNVYLELIWVEDEELLREVAPELGYTLLGRPDTSPFGIGLRSVGSDPASLPFESSSYWAEWMRPFVSLTVARRDDDVTTDPAIFVVPRYMRWDLRTEAKPDLLRSADHPLGLSKVTRIRVHGPGLPSDSEAVRFLTSAGLVEFGSAESHLLELEFDNRRGRQVDLRPTLPLVIYH